MQGFFEKDPKLKLGDRLIKISVSNSEMPLILTYLLTFLLTVYRTNYFLRELFTTFHMLMKSFCGIKANSSPISIKLVVIF